MHDVIQWQAKPVAIREWAPTKWHAKRIYIIQSRFCPLRQQLNISASFLHSNIAFFMSSPPITSRVLHSWQLMNHIMIGYFRTIFSYLSRKSERFHHAEPLLENISRNILSLQTMPRQEMPVSPFVAPVYWAQVIRLIVTASGKRHRFRKHAPRSVP